jgi:hypothetical protein
VRFPHIFSVPYEEFFLQEGRLKVSLWIGTQTLGFFL